MRTITHPVNGTETVIRVPETVQDFDAALFWVADHHRVVLALDIETTGLDTYSPGFAVRTVQIGNVSEAWVLRVGHTDNADAVIRVALRNHPSFVLHNAPFDVLALDRVGLADARSLLPRCYDTYILSHILDPRARGEDGALGHALKDLTEVYVDPTAQDPKRDMAATFKALGARRFADGWALEGLTEQETYLRYAGLDVIYTSRLLAVLGNMVREAGWTRLAQWEHEIRRATTRMMHRGILVDVPYTLALVEELKAEEAHHAAAAAQYGVLNINSVAQVRKALVNMGVKLTARTPTGNVAVDKDVLLPLAGMTPYWTPIEGAEVNPLASAIVHAKRAAKFRVAYAEAFLALRDSDDRLHASINSLAARTARMSVSHPALQQLPGGDWRIRRCLIADPGHVFVSSDFSQVELRVLAANANVHEMKDAIRTGADLHDRTATLIWGPDFTKRQRGIAKNVAFGKVYGAGPAKIAATAGISLREAKDVVDAFNSAYPEVPRYANKLQRDAAQDGWSVHTYTGRRLPLSRERSYVATNHCVQSTARDLFAAALLRAAAIPGIDDTMSLVIHDEILTQVPVEMAEEHARLMASTMAGTYRGVPIATESEVLWGGSWGSGYGIPPERDAVPEQHERPPFKVQAGPS